MQESTTNVPSRTFGIDLSDELSKYCLIDASGEVLKEGAFPTTITGVDTVFAEVAQSRVVLEASTQTPWVTRRIEELGHEVIVANPRQLHLISKSTRKTDRNDARILARLGRIDPSLLSPIHPRDEGCLAVRALLGARRQIVATRTCLIALVRSECKVHGVRLASASSEGFAKMARRGLPDVLHRALLPVIELFEVLNRQIRHYDKEIEQLGKRDYPKTEVLRQVRGVGPQLSLAYAATIGDPRRFEDSRNVAAYVGLVPRSFQTGASDPSLRISKQGDRALRTLLVNAATYILRRSSPDTALKRFGRRVATRGTPRDKARARIAVARKLAVLLHRLLLTGEVYEPLRNVTA